MYCYQKHNSCIKTFKICSRLAVRVPFGIAVILYITFSYIFNTLLKRIFRFEFPFALLPIRHIIIGSCIWFLTCIRKEEANLYLHTCNTVNVLHCCQFLKSDCTIHYSKISASKLGVQLRHCIILWKISDLKKLFRFFFHDVFLKTKTSLWRECLNDIMYVRFQKYLMRFSLYVN